MYGEDFRHLSFWLFQAFLMVDFRWRVELFAFSLIFLKHNPWVFPSKYIRRETARTGKNVLLGLHKNPKISYVLDALDKSSFYPQ